MPRYMNQNISQEITLFRDFISQNNDIGIVIGEHQNLDTVGAALSMYLSLSQSGKNVQIISKKAPTVEVSGLVGVDKITSSFSGNTSKLVVSLPYIKGEVEKVLFTEAPNTINFHLTAAADKSITPFQISDIKLNWEGSAPQAIIAVGVGLIDELSGVIDVDQAKIVNIDNYQGNSRFGDVVLVDTSFSSLSEVVGKVIKDLSLKYDIDTAQNILDGVLFATRNFTKPNTSPLAFEAASAAMYSGAQRKNEEQPRREQQHQDRNQRQPMNVDRNVRDQRPHGNNHNQQPPRVTDTDFPAMHMQGQRNQTSFNQPSSQQSQDPRRNQPRHQQGNNNRPQQNSQMQNNRPANKSFGQNSNDIDDLMRKINEENNRVRGASQGQNQQNSQSQQTQQNSRNMPNHEPIVEEPQFVDDQKFAPQDVVSSSMPQNNSFDSQNSDEVPDDWLMPKVFKSSKNNN